MLGIEVRPSEGAIARGDRVTAADDRRDGYLTVRRARVGERHLGIALTNAHALNFVALTRDNELPGNACSDCNPMTGLPCERCQADRRA